MAKFGVKNASFCFSLGHNMAIDMRMDNLCIRA